jgi:hypothetical protein
MYVLLRALSDAGILLVVCQYVASAGVKVVGGAREVQHHQAVPKLSSGVGRGSSVQICRGNGMLQYYSWR